jgi:polyhydroxyalkanoate synthesis regulator protein
MEMFTPNFETDGDAGDEKATPKKSKPATKKKAEPKENLDDLVSQLEAMQQQLNQLKDKGGK